MKIEKRIGTNVIIEERIHTYRISEQFILKHIKDDFGCSVNYNYKKEYFDFSVILHVTHYRGYNSSNSSNNAKLFG